MKKVLLVLAIGAFAACGSGSGDNTGDTTNMSSGTDTVAMPPAGTDTAGSMMSGTDTSMNKMGGDTSMSKMKKDSM